MRLGILVAAALAAAPIAVTMADARDASATFVSRLSVRVSDSSSCHRVDEVNTSLFPEQQIIGYDFSGADAVRLSQALSSAVDSASPGAAQIRVVLVLGTYEAIAFEFGADGCHMSTVNFEIEDMVKAFDRAGLPPPFNTTWSRMGDRTVWGLNP